MEKHAADQGNGIVGRWRSPPRGWLKGEWGPSRLLLELKPPGKIKLTVNISEKSPGGGGVLSMQGTYRITDGRLITEVISRGEPVEYKFKADRYIPCAWNAQGGQRLHIAEGLLEKAEKLPGKDAELYLARMEVAFGLGYTSGSTNTIHREPRLGHVSK